MVDRIDKIRPDHTRIEGARDSLEDEGGQEFAGDDEGEGDGFESVAHKTDWKILIERPEEVKQKRIDVPLGAVLSLKFLSLNLKTNPALLGIDVNLSDGRRFPKALVVVPRHKAMLFQGLKGGAKIKPQEIVEGEFFSCYVPEVGAQDAEDESTRILNTPENTFSRTLKRFLPRSILERFGVKDPETHQTVNEVVAAYFVGAIVIFAVLFAAYMIFA